MERAAAARLPTIYEFPEAAEEGGFAAYGPRLSVLFEAMARQVVQVLRVTKVADIPVEQATKFELVINLKTAKAMGVTVPETLLSSRQGDRVIGVCCECRSWPFTTGCLFRGRSSLTGHCGHCWTCSLPRPVRLTHHGHDPLGQARV